MEWSNVVNACKLIQQYCNNCLPCSHDCPFFDTEELVCKIDGEPTFWNIPEDNVQQIKR